MRLNRLDLVRYGKFTGRSLDFGLAKPGSPDLHVVYGPNEAGKSTLFSAFLDFLFGIEHLSGYGFLHPYPTMRVGGEIEAGGRLHEAYRVKRKQNTLLGADEQTLPDNLFSGALGSIDRTTYKMMFSLDDDSIEKGGESILKSEGELGTLLFSASSGMPDSNAILSALKGEAESFYKPRGQKHHLGERKAELEALKDEKAAIDTNARDYAMLRKARDMAAERHGKASEARTDARLALEFARDKIGGLALLERLRSLRSELAIGDDDRDPPSAWHALLPQLLQRDVELSTRLAQIETDVRRREAERDGVVIDAAVLAAEPLIRDLEQSDLEARHRTALKDMPSRLDERDRAQSEIARLLVRLGRDPDEDPLALVLPAAITGRLQDLAQRHSGLAEKLSGARSELQQARQDNGEAVAAQARLSDDDEGDIETDPSSLADLLRLARQDDCIRRQKAARRQIAGLEDQLDERLAALSPFSGSADDLVHMPVPVAVDVEEWKRRLAALEGAGTRRLERIADERTGMAAESGRLDELTRLGGFAGDEDALVLRAARDEAWSRHLENFDRPSAAFFESAMKRDDEASALRLAQSERLAQARGLSLTLAERKARLALFEVQALENRTALEALVATLAAAASLCGLPDATSVAQLETWLAKRLSVLDARTELRAAQRELEAAVDDEQDLRRRLALQLNQLGAEDAPDSLDDAILFADALVVRIQALRSRKDAAAAAVERTTRALEARSEALAAAEDAMGNWTHDWADSTAQTWLGGQDRQVAASEIGPVLAVLQDLDKLLQRKSDLDHRIDGMRRDQTAFCASVDGIATQMEIAAADPLAAFVEAKVRLSALRDNQTLLTRLADESAEKQRERQGLVDDQASHDAAKQDMLAFFGCETLGEVDIRLEAVKARDRLRARIDETGRDLLTRLKVATTEQAESILAAVDIGELERDVVTLESRLEECDRDAADAHAERREAEKALATIGGDDRAAHLDEQRRTILLDIEEKAMTYLRLRAGILSTEMALRLYRERHRSAMMQRASAAFNRISGGEYAGLSTQSENGKEFLIANAASGASKVVGDHTLSKGTQFQLYLALRMAGYHEVAATRESLPFIADDIMETFDDGRAEHAFGLMADMAKVGQVIYLTHHQHLCDLARRACPDATIHTL
ncbi:sugar translocase [Rhizobium sp. 58]|nr:sugar translocase [Rhizobium sp. 58]